MSRDRPAPSADCRNAAASGVPMAKVPALAGWVVAAAAAVLTAVLTAGGVPAAYAVAATACTLLVLSELPGRRQAADG